MPGNLDLIRIDAGSDNPGDVTINGNSYSINELKIKYNIYRLPEMVLVGDDLASMGTIEGFDASQIAGQLDSLSYTCLRYSRYLKILTPSNDTVYTDGESIHLTWRGGADANDHDVYHKIQESLLDPQTKQWVKRREPVIRRDIEDGRMYSGYTIPSPEYLKVKYTISKCRNPNGTLENCDEEDSVILRNSSLYKIKITSPANESSYSTSTGNISITWEGGSVDRDGNPVQFHKVESMIPGGRYEERYREENIRIGGTYSVDYTPSTDYARVKIRISACRDGNCGESDEITLVRAGSGGGGGNGGGNNSAPTTQTNFSFPQEKTFPRMNTNQITSLDFSDVPTASSYNIQIINSAGAKILNTNSTVSNVSSNLPDGRYRLWVQAVNSIGAGPWSSIYFNVSTTKPPQQPSAASVTVQMTDKTGLPVFNFQRPAITNGYMELWVNGISPVANRYLITKVGNSSIYEVTQKMPNGAYTAWVRECLSPTNCAAWSPGYNFKISEIILDVRMTGPSDTTVTKPTFTWEGDDKAVTYELWVNQVGGTTKIIDKNLLSGKSFTSSIVLPKGTYDVWVRSRYSNGLAGKWSPKYSFKRL